MDGVEMDRKILVISETVFFNLYKEGLEKYAKDNRDIVDLYYLDYPKKKLNIINKVKYKYNINNFKGKYYTKIRNELISKIKNYDIILFINLFYDDEYFIQGEFAEALKKKDTRVFFVDSIKTIDQKITFFDVFKDIYSFEEQDIVYGKEKFNVNIKYTTIGTLYKMFLQDEKYSKDIDVCFVGIGTEKRLKYLDTIAEYCEKNKLRFFVAGHFWHDNNWLNYHIGHWKFKNRHSVLAKYVENKFIVPRELAKIYARSKIVLNINVAYHKSLNQRCFDVMACNSLLLNDKQNIGNLPLIDGKDFIMCEDENDMVHKIDFYLNHQEACNEIINSGMIKTEREFLFSHTLMKLLH